MSVGRKKLSVCQNNVAAFSCCCNVFSAACSPTFKEVYRPPLLHLLFSGFLTTPFYNPHSCAAVIISAGSAPLHGDPLSIDNLHFVRQMLSNILSTAGQNKIRRSIVLISRFVKRLWQDKKKSFLHDDTLTSYGD